MTDTTAGRLAVAAALVLLAASAPLSAGAAEPEYDQEHVTHPNLVGVFAGFTGEVRRERSLSLGLEYYRRLNDSFGVGALVERASGDRDFWIAAVPFGWHLGHWKLYVAPGIEHEEGHGDHALLRLGVEYAFEFGKYEVAPQVDIDFIEGDTVVVMGVTVGIGF